MHKFGQPKLYDFRVIFHLSSVTEKVYKWISKTKDCVVGSFSLVDLSVEQFSEEQGTRFLSFRV